jgi:NAD(P)-dependent dehydrogenase (short-subunit alcohol dehydrogenase family)
MASSGLLSLAGKVAIVTGSGKENGIGCGIALALVHEGARVTINYVSESTTPRALEVVKKIEAVGGKGCVVLVRADISTPEGCKTLVEETLKGFGTERIDILGRLTEPMI